MKPKKEGFFKVVLPFCILALIIILIIAAGLSLIKADVYILPKGNTAGIPFETDQILLKVVLKENEFFSKDLKIISFDNKPVNVRLNLEGGKINELITLSQKNFVLAPGKETKVAMFFTAKVTDILKNTQPGVYVGKLTLSSDKGFTKIIPVIVEIETKKVDFDIAIAPTAKDKRVVKDSSTAVELTIFNLVNAKNVFLNIDYDIIDLDNNKFLSQSENVSVSTKLSFLKTINIPKNLKNGNYVFAAQAKHGSAVGTVSYLFEVVTKKEFFTGIGACQKSPVCVMSLLFIIGILFAVILYGYLLYKYILPGTEMDIGSKKPYYIVWVILLMIGIIVIIANADWVMAVLTAVFDVFGILGVIAFILGSIGAISLVSKYLYVKYLRWREYALEKKEVLRREIERKGREEELAAREKFYVAYFYNLPLIRNLHELGIIKTPEERIEIEERFDHAVLAIEKRMLEIETKNNIISANPLSKRAKLRLSLNYNIDRAILGAINSLKQKLAGMKLSEKNERKSIKVLESKAPLSEIIKVRRIRKKFMQKLGWHMAYIDKKKDRVAEETVRMKADLEDIYSDRIEQAMDDLDKLSGDYHQSEIEDLKKSKYDEIIAEKNSDLKELNISKQFKLEVLEKKRAELRKKFENLEKKALAKYDMEALKRKGYLAKKEAEQWRNTNKAISELLSRQESTEKDLFIYQTQHEYLAFKRKEYYWNLFKSRIYEMLGIKQKEEVSSKPIKEKELDSGKEIIKPDSKGMKIMYHVPFRQHIEKLLSMKSKTADAKEKSKIIKKARADEKIEQQSQAAKGVLSSEGEVKGSSNLKNCVLNINKCEAVYKKGDISQAQLLYVKAVNSYLKLSEEEKTNIHRRLETLYEDINRAKKKKK